MSDTNEKPNYYELLCIGPSATKDEIKRAYRRQALLFHPDKMKPHMKEEASQHFQLISEAYDVLSDDRKRELYDRYGEAGVKAGGDPNPQPESFFDLHPAMAQTQGRGGDFAGFGFDNSFFGGFPGMDMHQHFHNHAFANHHQQHMRSMFESFGAPHSSMFNDPFLGAPQFPGSQRPTLFSQSPFAQQQQHHHQYHQQQQQQQQTQAQQPAGWTGAGTSSNPFTDFSNNFGFNSSRTSGGQQGGGGYRTSTRTTIVNGQRTTVTEVIDAEGVTTTTVQNPDGSQETFVNGAQTSATAAIDGGQTGGGGGHGRRHLEGNQHQPIFVDDDDDGERGGRRGGGGGNRNNGPYRAYSDRHGSDEGRRGAATMNNPIIVDDDGDVTTEQNPTLARASYLDAELRSHSTSGGIPEDHSNQETDPNLHHPRMGRGHTLRGSSVTSTRPQYSRT